MAGCIYYIFMTNILANVIKYRKETCFIGSANPFDFRPADCHLPSSLPLLPLSDVFVVDGIDRGPQLFVNSHCHVIVSDNNK